MFLFVISLFIGIFIGIALILGFYLRWHYRILIELKVFCMQLSNITITGGSISSWPITQYNLSALYRLEAWRRWEVVVNKRDGYIDYKHRHGLPPINYEFPANIPIVFSRMFAKKTMEEDNTPVMKDLVLIGGGHAHVHVLKMFGMKRIPGLQIVLISRKGDTPYSGMLPGYVAGHYTKEEAYIDLYRIARFAGARLVIADVCGIDRKNKYVLMKSGRPPIPYDVLSIDIGCTPAAQSFNDASNITPVKPIDSFNVRWKYLIKRVLHETKYAQIPQNSQKKQCSQIVVVGGGAAGVELALSIQYRLHNELRANKVSTNSIQVMLLTRSNTVLPTHGKATQKIFSRILKDRGIKVEVNREVINSTDKCLMTKCGKKISYDHCVWCTQASTQSWLRESGFDVDKEGFICVDFDLQSTNTPDVFAAGDCCSMKDPRPKSGVFAVFAGMPLAKNLRRTLLGSTKLAYYKPQKFFLGLIGTGDPDLCVASRGEIALEGAWLWTLKDFIDRRWMSLYGHDLPIMEEPKPEGNPLARAAGKNALDVLAHASMRCGGCGAKVGSTVLSRVIKRLKYPTRKEVLVGLAAPDDCAVVKGSSMASVHTVDFFRSFIDDPYIFGKIAANHALSDCHAMCADAQTALAIAVVPFALESKVEDSLYQMMTGACEMLAESKCALVGGHSCEGRELSLGFSINGLIQQDTTVLKKEGMEIKDVLIVTKPLGTGTIFAAEMRMQAKSSWIQEAVKSMILSNRSGAFCLRDHKATSCTDITGFGLLGHLVEMTKASKTVVRINLDKIPVMEGALKCVERGIFSSLQPANLRVKRAISNEAEALKRNHKAYPLLFDPQTAGGLLASVPPDKAQECILKLHELGYYRSVIIGEVIGKTDQSGNGNARVELVWDNK